MNFAFTEDQILIRDSARGWLGDFAPVSHVRQVMATAEGYDRALWAEVAAMGWTGLIVPEDLGGSGLGFVELAILCEEMGRRLYPSPFEATVVLAANALLALGSDRLLDRIATGETTATLAAGNATGKVTAIADGGSYRLDGVMRHVPDGARADVILVAADLDGRTALFALEGAVPGLAREGLASMDQTRRPAELRFEAAIVSAGALVSADADKALTIALDRAAAMMAAHAVGAAEQCLDMTVEYTKGRVQFGRPVASFQAVKHQCADMALAVETARSAAYWASCVADDTGHNGDGTELAMAASGAKSWCSRAYFDCAATAIQLHGGVGFTWEYDVHLYFKNARAVEAILGDPASHRERVAGLLGLDELAEAAQ